MKKILILGGGFAGIETYKQLHRRLHPFHYHGVRVELINRTNYLTFMPMLHEVATGSVAREHAVQSLREVMRCCGSDLHQTEVTSIDVPRRIVHTTRGDYSYDYLVVGLGVEQGYFGIPGAAEHSLPLKGLPGAVAIRNRIIRAYEAASETHDDGKHDEVRKHLHFIIVGGGSSGVELAGQVADLLRNEMRLFYRDLPHDDVMITLVHRGDRLLEQLNPRSSSWAHRRLTAMGVKVMFGEQVTRVQEDCVTLASGSMLPSYNVFWTAGTEPRVALCFAPNHLTPENLLAVRATFQVCDAENIFALGDCAEVIDAGFRYPPTAQAAKRASVVVAENIIRSLQNQPLIQRRFWSRGDVVPIGDWYGIFEHDWFRFHGRLAWLLRRSVFLATMYSWGKRLRVASDWAIKVFQPRDTSEF